jgi:hypothetical protein
MMTGQKSVLVGQKSVSIVLIIIVRPYEEGGYGEGVFSLKNMYFFPRS